MVMVKVLVIALGHMMSERAGQSLQKDYDEVWLIGMRLLTFVKLNIDPESGHHLAVVAPVITTPNPFLFRAGNSPKLMTKRG